MKVDPTYGLDGQAQATRLNPLGSSPGGTSVTGGKPGPAQAAREFEAYFVQTMMKEMRKTVQHSGLFGGRESVELFESMLDEALGERIAQGKGMGLAAQLQVYLAERDPEGDALRLPRAERLPTPATWSSRPFRQTPYSESDSDRISSGFGSRIHPIHGERHFHSGIDIPMSEGTPVRAAAPGKVVFAGEQGGYGQLVVVEHPNGFTTRYAHNSRLRVQEGQHVTEETILAESGNTGSSTGPHLHFEVRKDGEAVDPTRARWARIPR